MTASAALLPATSMTVFAIVERLSPEFVLGNMCVAMRSFLRKSSCSETVGLAGVLSPVRLSSKLKMLKSSPFH